MRTIELRAGEAIFRVGEPSRAVYVIDRGTVAIRCDGEGSPMEIARLHDGSMFGESGVLENRPRSATAIAIADTTLLETDAQTFLKAFGLDNDKPLSLLKLLCGRLRSTSRRAVEWEARIGAIGHQAPGRFSAVPRKLLLVPDSEWLENLVGGAPVDIAVLPFQVGNRYGGEVSTVSSERNFCVPAAADTAFSSPHFEILLEHDQLLVRDLSRHAGTIVNREAISRFASPPSAALRPGINRIIAGHLNSPIRFELIVEP